MIAFLCSPYHRGGVTRWMIDAAIEWAKKESVYFIAVTPSNKFYSSGGQETVLQLLNAEDHNVQVITRSVGWEFEFGTSEYRSHVYAELIKNLPVGTPVILANDASLWQTSVLLSGQYKFIGVLHGDEEYYYKDAYHFHKTISKLVSVSERISSKLIARYPEIIASSVYTIPCGIVLPAYLPRQRTETMLNLAFVGRIEEYQKRVSDIPKICAGLKDAGVSFRFHIIGGGEIDSLKDQFARNDLDKHVTFYGWVGKTIIFDRLRQCDFLLLTSNFEGMPIAVMEAMALGCGVISTRVSGVEDLEELPGASDSLWLYEVGNVNEAVDKIQQAEKKTGPVMNQAARNMAESEFSMETCISRYKKVIETIPDVSEKYKNFRSLSITHRLYSFALALLRYNKVKFLNK